ncbi:hypothetical protein ACOSQ3_031018 [Xanthoceras sorbifolium]
MAKFILLLVTFTLFLLAANSSIYLTTVVIDGEESPGMQQRALPTAVSPAAIAAPLQVVLGSDEPPRTSAALLIRYLRVDLSGSGEETIMLLRYECLPEYCFGCGKIGHAVHICPFVLDVDAGRSKQEEYGAWLRASSPTRRNTSAAMKDKRPSSSGTDSGHNSYLMANKKGGEQQQRHLAPSVSTTLYQPEPVPSLRQTATGIPPISPSMTQYHEFACGPEQGRGQTEKTDYVLNPILPPIALVSVESSLVVDTVTAVPAKRGKRKRWARHNMKIERNMVPPSVSGKRTASWFGLEEHVSDSWRRIRRIEQELDELLGTEERYWKDRSSVNWLRHDDRNTRFFHMTALGRRAQNMI